MRLKHGLNQQQGLDLGYKLNTEGSKTKICKTMALMVVGLAVEYGTKEKTLEQG